MVFPDRSPATSIRRWPVSSSAWQIEPDGSVGHLVNMMLIGPDGRLVREYNGQIVKAQDIVDDVKKTLNNG